MRDWNDWAQALEGSKRVIKHILTFDFFYLKVGVVEYLDENIFPTRIDDCPGEKKIEFTTDIELTRAQRRRLFLDTGVAKHEEEEL